MPPSLVVVALVALGAPAALRAAIGRPRSIVAGHLAAATAALVAQVGGELGGWRVGVLGDAQLFPCLAAALLAAGAVAIIERRPV